MVTWIKTIFALLILSLAVSAANAQSVLNQANANSIYRSLGGYAADKWFILPNDTLPELTTSLIRHGGLLAYKYPYVYQYDTVANSWVRIATDVDSSIFATVTRLADTAAAIRADIPVITTPSWQQVTDVDSVTTTQITSSNHTITPLNDTSVNTVENGGVVLTVIDTAATDFTLKSTNRIAFSAAGNDNRLHLGYNIGHGITRDNTNRVQARLDFEQAFTIGAPYSSTMSEFHYNFLNLAGVDIRPIGVYNSHTKAVTDDNSSLIELISSNGRFHNPASTIDFLTWEQSTGVKLYAPVIGSASGTSVYVKDGAGVFSQSTQIGQGLVANLTSDLSSINTELGLRWNVAGNSITQGNFIGTTNNADLIFKTGGAEKARIDSQTASIIINQAVSPSVLPTASLEVKTISASSNIVFNAYNSAGTLFGQFSEGSTGGGGGVFLRGVRNAATGTGFVLQSYNVAGASYGVQILATGGVPTAPISLPANINLFGVAKFNGAAFPDQFVINNSGKISVIGAATPAVNQILVGDGVDMELTAISTAVTATILYGNATLSGGTIAVANTATTANSVVVCQYKTISGTTGDLTYTLNAGVGFTINSTSGADNSVVSYSIRY